ncbi:hypothetical protein NLJ89_g1045 [Agrocybe chaxingu]|uniref:Uncharacterized protein n=1 Tax=Agrocybe chaxingu TaxID=84603 RepID=A0A9W8N0R8_9AGAR|nr:hypothetical protein NLJ89_g1045 [Agrocybe chaxingu]
MEYSLQHLEERLLKGRLVKLGKEETSEDLDPDTEMINFWTHQNLISAVASTQEVPAPHSPVSPENALPGSLVIAPESTDIIPLSEAPPFEAETLLFSPSPPPLKRKRSPSPELSQKKTCLSKSIATKSKLGNTQKLDRPKIGAPGTVNTKVSGQSKGAKLKQKLNAAVLDGTFVHDPRKWAKYKATLKRIDKGFEVDDKNPRLARIVRHSRCGEKIRQKMPYDTSAFNDHVTLCDSKPVPTNPASETRTLDSIFCVQYAAQNVLPASNQFRLNDVPCPGLSSREDPRIRNYLLRTQSSSAGGISERKLAMDEYGTAYGSLSAAQKEFIDLKQHKTHRWRIDHAHGRIYAIGISPCSGVGVIRTSDSVKVANMQKEHPCPCSECNSLLSIREFKNAIQRAVPTDKNRAFVPDRHQNVNLGKLHMKTLGLQKLLDDHEEATEERSGNIFMRFARQYAEGNFDSENVFLGLLEVMVERADRSEKKKGFQNMKYPPAFDDWCHELLCIRPEAYRTFQLHFGGRSERSFRKIRSMKPAFSQGISEQTVARAARYLSDYGYPREAPLATGVDDTKLLPAFRPYYDNTLKKWFMVGGTGEPMEVVDINQLQQQIAAAKDLKASKLRLWTMSIPLPRVPPLVLAASPIASKTSAKQLASMEKSLLEHLITSEWNFNIISLGSDGTSVEREARREFQRSGFAETVTYQIPHPDKCSGPIKVELLKIFNRFMAVIQDSKHGRKTERNNIHSGAKSLVLGRFFICYQDIRKIAFDTTNSPLYIRDVEKLDRQDDRAAARLFSAATLEYIVQNDAENIGLLVYLFVFGELIDAYQSRKISHHERVRMVLRAKIFKDTWKAFLKEAGYATGRHFLSPEADDILDIIINGFLALLYIHRDILECHFPLLPWRHGSEANEHVFGFLRDDISDFTMLDVLRLIPKLAVRLMAACKHKSSKANLQRTAGGYSHTYSDSDDADLHFLSIFPSDREIALIAEDAYEEAMMLWELLGYYPSATALVNVRNFTMQMRVPTEVSNAEMSDDEGDSDGEDDDNDDEVSPRQQLQNALDDVAARQAEGCPSENVDNALDECSYAAACFNLNDLEKIEKLPENDAAALKEIQQALSATLRTIYEQGPAGAAAVRDLLAAHSIPMDPRLDAPSTHTTADATTANENSPRNARSDPLDLSGLVKVRFVNQSRESTDGVRSIRSREVEETQKKQKFKEPTERQLLAKKIYDILRLDAEQGTSTGLNRRVRYETITSGSLAAPQAGVSGNSANAQAAARSGASAIVAKRRKEFALIPLGGDLATAKVDMLSKLQPGCYGIVMIDDELMLAKVLTIYQRGGGKVAKHAWASEADTIGSVSYLPVQAWQHVRQRKFRTHWGATLSLGLPRYAHLPSNAFLYFVPKNAVRVLNDGAFLEVDQAFFENVFSKLLLHKEVIVRAVKKLLKRRKKDEDEGIVD